MSVSGSIYLDHAATTILDPEVRRVIKQYLDKPINANPSSRHRYGLDMQQIIRSSKNQISSLLGITTFREKNIVFTSGATEANNLIIFGHCMSKVRSGMGKHIVVGPSEHDCVREAVFALAKNNGFTYTISKLLPNGQLDLTHLESILTPKTILVCQMAVSNIFGTIYDVEGVSRMMKKVCPNALLHIDAVQAIGKIPFQISKISSHIPTSISLSAHKIHGPKGIGVLAFDHPNPQMELRLKPITYGGGQENGSRPGTENLLGIIAVTKAISRAMMELGSSQQIFRELHKSIMTKINGKLPDRTMCWVMPEVSSHQAIVSIVTPTVPSEVVFNHLMQHNVYVSVGSACQAREGKLSPALVQRFPKNDKSLARHVLRISFCRFTTVSEVERAVGTLAKILPPLHQSSPLRKEIIQTETTVVPPPPPPSSKKKPKKKGKKKKKSDEDEDEEEIEEEGEDMPTKQISGKKRKKSGRPKRKKISDDFTNMEFSRIVCRVGELALKKKNRKIFERQLAKNIRTAIKPICDSNVEMRDRRLYITPRNDVDRHFIPKIAQRLTKIFGLTSVSLCFRVTNDITSITSLVCELAKKRAEKYLLSVKSTRDEDEDDDKGSNDPQEKLEKKISFRISTKRSNKGFPMKSMEVSRNIGGIVLQTSPLYYVDLKNPMFEIGIDIRGEGTYIFTEKIACAGGLPIGTTGRGVTLLSGGIDSPVASWMMMKRGMTINYVSFFSFPYTSEQYLVKLKKLGEKLAMYQQTTGKMHFVPLTKIQEAIRDHAKPESYRTILYRRAMNRLGLMVARRVQAKCLITGESLGQVASQTIPNITAILQPVGRTMPIFRPLIGMDKGEIMDIARQIGTYEISNQEAADTCTLFKPRAPVIYSKLDIVEKAEKMVPEYEKLLQDAINNMSVFDLKENMFEEEEKKEEKKEEEEDEAIAELQPAQKKRKLDHIEDEEEEEEEGRKKMEDEK